MLGSGCAVFHLAIYYLQPSHLPVLLYTRLNPFSLAILQSKGHDGTEDHACVLFYKAAAHEKKEQNDLAIVCYEGSVQYYQKLLGSDAMKIAVVLEKLGTCLLNDHEPDKAKVKLEEAIRIRKTHQADNDL